MDNLSGESYGWSTFLVWRKVLIGCFMVLFFIVGYQLFSEETDIYTTAPDIPVMETKQVVPVHVKHSNLRYVTEKEAEKLSYLRTTVPTVVLTLLPIDLQSRSLRHIGFEMRAELRHVVGEEGGLVAGARDRDITEAGVEQVRMDARVCVNEDAFRGQALGAVAGDRVTMIEMAMLASVKLDVAVVVEASRDAAIGLYLFDHSQVAISNA